MFRLVAFLAPLLTLLVGLGPLDAAAKDQPRIAVLELSGPLKAQELALMSDQIRSGVLRGLQGKPYLVMSRENMAAIAQDMNIDLSCVEGQCEVDTARNLGAAWVVSASLVQMGGRWMCTLKVHDVGTGGLKASGKVDGSEAIDLVDQLPPLAERLVAEALGSSGTSPVPGQVSVKPGADGDVAALAAREATKKAERDLMAEVETERKRMAEEEVDEKAMQEPEGLEGQAEPNKNEVQQPQPTVKKPQRSGIMGSSFLGSFGLTVGGYRYLQEPTDQEGSLLDEDMAFTSSVLGVDLRARYLRAMLGGEFDAMAIYYSGDLPEPFQSSIADWLHDFFFTGLIRWDAGVIRPAVRLGVGVSDFLVYHGQDYGDDLARLEYFPLLVSSGSAGLEVDAQVLEHLYARAWLDLRLAKFSTYSAISAGLEVLYPIKTNVFVSASFKGRNRAIGVWKGGVGSDSKPQVGVLEDSFFRGVLSVGYMR